MSRPLVLSIAGHDPTGGAGIQADIEAIVANGGRACSIITALTAQDSRNVAAVLPQDAGQLRTQLRLLWADMPPAAIKIGLLGSAEIARTLVAEGLLQSALPLVIDPVLAAGGGTRMADDAWIESLTRWLLPHATVATPNGPEARRLAGCTDLAEAARRLTGSGCGYLLVTGGHEDGDEIVDLLYNAAGKVSEFRHPRLPGQYHGSGCTLSAALATRLARGEPIEQAVMHALQYTAVALRHAQQVGQGQSLPDRMLSPYDPA